MNPDSFFSLTGIDLRPCVYPHIPAFSLTTKPISWGLNERKWNLFDIYAAVFPDCSQGMTQSINAVAQQPPQNYQHQPAQSGEFSSGPDPSSAAAPTKSRMRWTQELHEAFVEAVSKLGGSERA